MVSSELLSSKKNADKKPADGLSEFEIIRHYFSGIGREFEARSEHVIISGGDDCALLALPENQQLAVSIDTLVANRHFPADASPDDIAFRALAVSVSDLAAMGARPIAFTLALTLPEFEPRWLAQFSQGLTAAAQQYGMALIGGDTTRGPLTITLQVHGAVAPSMALRRSAAQAGDKIFVSGSLGDAAIALDILQQRLSVTDEFDYFYSRFYRPSARVDLGQALVGVANTAIDISDGLLADLGHILAASDVAAQLQLAQLPRSAQMSALVDKGLLSDAVCEQHMLSGGDDYELCFTVGAEQCESLIKISEKFAINITEVGAVVPYTDRSKSRLQCFDKEGELVVYQKTGFQHF